MVSALLWNPVHARGSLGMTERTGSRERPAGGKEGTRAKPNLIRISENVVRNTGTPSNGLFDAQ